ncbi:hypothetical protein RB195_004100 [Necator americanus]|uniref:C2H2-type domain-containing protein n=1 Tax=Necator americanus TaxID=51031 RepID=A0ABR1BKI7_NECAM
MYVYGPIYTESCKSLEREQTTRKVCDQAEVRVYDVDIYLRNWMEKMVEMSSVCPSPSTPTFDLATFLSGALQIKKDAHFISKFATLPTTPAEVLLNQIPLSPNNEGRKRRRGEAANPANTLDGLVARRADDTHEPFQKRYLSEQEAIEGPDDEAEAKRMEKDPDVSTRTCSTCGYVGKWISEMIRHKRVHTNERPFKCRYCSRTSKWKADLIRHVAKTHGIRVVSKYSRSKAFDQTVTNLTNRDDDDKPRVYACEPDKEPKRQKQLPPLRIDAAIEVARPEPLLPSKTPLSYRCSQCFFEQGGLSVLIHHLRAVHSKSPYECRCKAAFESIGDALQHATTSGNCSSEDMVLNVVPIYNTGNHATSTSPSESMSPTRSRSDCSPDSGVQGDIEEVEIDSALRALSKTTSGDSENESGIGTTISPLLFPPTSATSPILPPLDVSAALLALQLPLIPDYFVTMASLMTPPAIATVTKPMTYKCCQCGARLHDVLAFVAHSRLHTSSVLPLVDTPSSEDNRISAAQQEQKEELVDVEM